ncbi:MAG: DUF6350 family protein [Kineosporiaceae bacterium]
MSTPGSPPAPPRPAAPARTGADPAASAPVETALPRATWVDGRTPVSAGAVAALQAACATLVVALVPAVGAWVAATDSDLPWTSAARSALQVWLLAHHTALVVDGGSLSLVPLTMALLAVASCWFAGRRLAGAVDPRVERVLAGRAAPSPPPARALVSFVASYTTLAFLAALLAASDAVRPLPGQAALGAFVVGACGVGLGAATYVAGTVGGGLRLAAEVLQVPWRVRAWARGAAWALGVQLLAGAVLLGVGILRGREAALAVHHALDPGAVGGAAMWLLQLAYLPDGVVWAASFVTGPGFAVGSGTFVTPAASSLGPLPAVPALAALPPTGSRTPALMALLAVGAIAGAVAAQVAARARRRHGGTVRLLPAALDALGLGAVAGLLMLVAAWAASGSIGPGRLAVAGPPALTTAAVFAAEVAAGALLWAGLSSLGRWMVAPARTGTRGATAPRDEPIAPAAAGPEPETEPEQEPGPDVRA